MNKMNLKNVRLFLFLIILGGCGGASPGEIDVDLSFDIPENYALYGEVDNHTIQVLTADAEETISVTDTNNNNTWDASETLAIALDNPSAKGTSEAYITVVLTPGSGHFFNTETLYDLGTSYVYLATGGATQSYNVESGDLFFTSFDTDEGDVISGEFKLTLTNGDELKGRFSGPLEIKNSGGLD